VSRLLRLTTPYLRAADRLGVLHGTARGRAVARVLAELRTDETLPRPDDAQAMRPPVRTAFVRRVPGRNLWLWYTLHGDVVFAVALTADPPIPLDG
jgi:hypothetical protein